MASAPLTVVIFGASGDLTARKLVPSLYRLDCKHRLPPEARIVGVARSPFNDDGFREKMAKSLQEFAKDDWNADSWEKFAQRLHYVQGDGSTADGLNGLRDWLARAEGTEANSARRLYYLSVGPDLYEPFVEHLGQVGLTQEPSPTAWRRLVIEKPFGRDLASARALNANLRLHLREDQTYRIDHYLGKETVQNILVFRFANTLFEPLWNNNYIDHVQITVAENVAVGSRAGYYDHSGVLRDMFQNHLLQLLALVAMEAPARYAADPLRNEKVKVLDAIPVLPREQARSKVVTGQYAGYREEKGVAPDSRTPTFAAVELAIDNWRWRGVPFLLRSGKALNSRSSEVVIQFRCPPHLMFPLPKGHTLQCNRLSVCIQPDEGIHVNFQTKVPGLSNGNGAGPESKMILQPSDLEFHYRDSYPGEPIPEAYERLILDVIEGDAALFMRSDEIERAWEIMDPIIACAEDASCSTPQEYARGSTGPAAADEFLARTGRQWLSLCHTG
jgi:glucose-6-phosphate 1-dehydrogenase